MHLHSGSDRANGTLSYATAAALGLVIAFLSGCAGHARHQAAQEQTGLNRLVVTVAQFENVSPNGVAVSRSGRMFVCFPSWHGVPEMAVAEVFPDGTLEPVPAGSWNQWDGHSGETALRALVCAQAVYVDEEDHLWVLDSGRPTQLGQWPGSGVVPGGPKLMKIDLRDNSVAQVFYMDQRSDMRPQSYLSDFRVDPETSTAYISDAGRGCIYVYDLGKQQSRTVLLDHASTKAEFGVMLEIGEQPWRGAFGVAPQEHVSGVELSNDRQWLYYSALTGRTLFRVPTRLLRDPQSNKAQIAAAVENLGSTGSAVDGMWMDEYGNLFLTALEEDGLRVRRADGTVESLVYDSRVQWPDAVAMGPDGYVYFTSTMRHLQQPYSAGDQREQPGYLLKASVQRVEAALARQHEYEAMLVQSEQVTSEAEAAEAKARHMRALAEAEQQELDRVTQETERLRMRAQAFAGQVTEIAQALDILAEAIAVVEESGQEPGEKLVEARAIVAKRFREAEAASASANEELSQQLMRQANAEQDAEASDADAADEALVALAVRQRADRAQMMTREALAEVDAAYNAEFEPFDESRTVTVEVPTGP